MATTTEEVKDTTFRDPEALEDVKEEKTDTSSAVPVVVETKMETVETTTTTAEPPTTTVKADKEKMKSYQSFQGMFAKRRVFTNYFVMNLILVIASIMFAVNGIVLIVYPPLRPITNFISLEIIGALFSLTLSLSVCMLESLGLLEAKGIRFFNASMQFFLWFALLGISTFIGDFVSSVDTPNGFFGAWMATFVSGAMLSQEVLNLTVYQDYFGFQARTGLAILFISSVMQMGAGILYYQSVNDPYVNFSIAYGVITAIFAMIFFIIAADTWKDFMFKLTMALLLWVYVGTLVLTFGFYLTALNNGYYAAIFGLFGATLAANDVSGYSRFEAVIRFMVNSSLIVLIASAQFCGSVACHVTIFQYQVALGAIGFVLALVIGVLHWMEMSDNVIQILCGLQLLWWIAGFYVVTFVGFNSVQFANGYFFTWISLILATVAFYVSSEKELHLKFYEFPQELKTKKTTIMLLFFGSCTTLGAAIQIFKFPYSAYAITLAVVSMFFVLVLLSLSFFEKKGRRTDKIFNIILYFLTLWWLVGALVLSFYPQSDFKIATNNGYFSIYFNLVCVLLLH